MIIVRAPEICQPPLVVTKAHREKIKTEHNKTRVGKNIRLRPGLIIG